MIYRHLYTDEFYEQNPKEPFQAQDLAHYMIKILDTEADELLQSLSMGGLSEERIASREQEAQSIAALNTGGEMIRYMRKHIDPLNMRVFLEKALSFEDELATDVIQRIKTSGNDNFIETATRFLSKSRNDYSKELMRIFDDIRSYYAQSMMLVVIGFRADEEAIPWVYEKYFAEFKGCDLDDGYRARGALVALDELFDRFYGNDETHLAATPKDGSAGHASDTLLQSVIQAIDQATSKKPSDKQ